MLIKFELENFRSFNKRTLFHTIQRNYKRFTHHVKTFNEDLKLLKTNAIFGGNGSGKTNLFKGLEFVKSMVLDHDYLLSPKSQSVFSPFRLDNTSRDKDAKFKVDFVVDKRIYSYELWISHKNNKVVFEELNKIENNEEEVVFTRKKDEYSNLSEFRVKDMNRELLASIEKIIPNHSTLLSIDILSEIDEFREATNWFKNKVKFLYPVYEFGDIAYILSRKNEYVNLASWIVKFSNLGIHRVKIDEIPISLYLGSEKSSQINQITSILEDKVFHPFYDSRGNSCTAVRKDDGSIVVMKLVTMHLDKDGEEVEFDLEQESRGTIVLIHLLPALILSYGEGVNYFIDEIGASLHPLLLKEILAQFLEHNVGSAEGQLIFNTHEDFIMDERILRQDEIWLLDKDDFGSSTIFPLSDFKHVRHDLKYRKNYLEGKFGGTPFDKDPGDLKFNVDNQ